MDLARCRRLSRAREAFLVAGSVAWARRVELLRAAAGRGQWRRGWWQPAAIEVSGQPGARFVLDRTHQRLGPALWLRKVVVRATLATAVASQYFYHQLNHDKNRCHIGKSKSKQLPKRTQWPPHRLRDLQQPRHQLLGNVTARGVQIVALRFVGRQVVQAGRLAAAVL
jgi:hypothetical protein